MQKVDSLGSTAWLRVLAKVSRLRGRDRHEGVACSSHKRETKGWTCALQGCIFHFPFCVVPTLRFVIPVLFILHPLVQKPTQSPGRSAHSVSKCQFLRAFFFQQGVISSWFLLPEARTESFKECKLHPRLCQQFWISFSHLRGCLSYAVSAITCVVFPCSFCAFKAKK